jgi:hypothetical protein
VWKEIAGITHTPLNTPYFNGAKPPNKNLLTNAAFQTTFTNHLIRFMHNLLGCTEAASAWTYTGTKESFVATHAVMNVDAATMDEFKTQIMAALASFVPPGEQLDKQDSDYLEASWQRFYKGGDMQVCSAADCPIGSAFAEYRVHALTGYHSATDKTTRDIQLFSGGSVHWDLGPKHSLVQVDSPTGTDMIDHGFSSGPASADTFGYTQKFASPGTYYWYVNGAPANANRGTITVVDAPRPDGTSAASSTVPAGALSALVLVVLGQLLL